MGFKKVYGVWSGFFGGIRDSRNMVGKVIDSKKSTKVMVRFVGV